MNIFKKLGPILVLSALTLACSKPHKHVEEYSSNIEQTFTLAYVCPDKDELYRYTDGSLMHWNAPSNDKGYFVKLDGSLTPELYCQAHQKEPK